VLRWPNHGGFSTFLVSRRATIAKRVIPARQPLCFLLFIAEPPNMPTSHGGDSGFSISVPGLRDRSVWDGFPQSEKRHLGGLELDGHGTLSGRL
jgi:hypothetical protein